MEQLKQPRFPGVYVAATTLFQVDGAVDFDACQAHWARLAEGGVTGVIPCGSLGEYEALTDDERAGVVKSAMDSVGKLARGRPWRFGQVWRRSATLGRAGRQRRVQSSNVPAPDVSCPDG